MAKLHYTPDKTWGNIRTVLHSKNRKPMILCCRKASEGVSPKSKLYVPILSLLSTAVGFSVFVLLRGTVKSYANMLCSDVVLRTTVIILIEILCWIASGVIASLLITLISFCIPKIWRRSYQSYDFNQTVMK